MVKLVFSYFQGDQIPAWGPWTTTLSKNNCTNVTGGALFYAYNRPNLYSSNTGFEVFKKDVLYFVVDSGDNVYFVLVHDKFNNGQGGYVNLVIDSPDLGGKNTQVCWLY